MCLSVTNLPGGTAGPPCPREPGPCDQVWCTRRHRGASPVMIVNCAVSGLTKSSLLTCLKVFYRFPLQLWASLLPPGKCCFERKYGGSGTPGGDPGASLGGSESLRSAWVCPAAASSPTALPTPSQEDSRTDLWRPVRANRSTAELVKFEHQRNNALVSVYISCNI